MRELALFVHRWVGLVVGVLVALLGLTGSVLIYEHEIDEALNPDLLRVSPGEERISPGTALGAVRASGVASTPEQFHFPQEPTEPYVFWVPAEDGTQARQEVMVDPYTGEVLGQRTENSGLVGTLFRLHTDLMAGPIGEQAVGWLGVLLLLLALTGAIVWWPLKFLPGRIRDALTVRWGVSTKRTNYDLHRAGGAWTLLYLILLGGTGAGLVFYTTAGHLLNAATGSDPVPAPPATTESSLAEDFVPVGSRPEALDAAWREARSALPEATFTYVSLGTEPSELLNFRGRMPSELHPNGRSFVWFDRWTGERLRVDDASQFGAGPTLLHAIYPIHIGAFELGPLGMEVIRAVWALLGLAPALLGITGFLVWWWRGGSSKPRSLRRRRGHDPNDSDADALTDDQDVARVA